ncbi:MAG TPA: 2,3-bisphosphoglycerate-independent phosphoglycerate mutase [Saprospiraceae bacterium]|jgi:2,3-bisphosphoglycerate-independent phosphoglycerate mutase|nr:2,3-bisphosphoglycerate-independent phosphoglycerate mutase [Saprospiraceae bacterium]HMT69163.1 2,3-bisphosphoglycerate-independent phosphoglycerate mutase [Saprospiraceae bacterium]
MNNVALIILDGWGINNDKNVSAIAAANTPVVDNLKAQYPHACLTTFGENVGLPDGQMGNSEVGHINIGAGRVVYQELARINKAFRERELLSNQVFLDAIQYAKSHTKRIHLLGLVSDGGVHSHIDHLAGLCEILKTEGQDIEVFIHAFMDGRDTDPKAGKDYLTRILSIIKDSNMHLATVIGRYYAMDRDRRWERVKLAYDLLVHGNGKASDDMLADMQNSYDEGVTDEFLQPLYNNHLDKNKLNIHNDDVVIFYNFRTDRPRQLTEVLTQKDFPEFDMHKLNLYYVTFANYDQNFENIHVVFEKDNLKNTLGQVISEAGLTQLRIAETEKYPHVTFFFNGGTEDKFVGEDRIMVPSPKVATYDLKPEMSAVEITDQLIEYIEKNTPNFICLNYANTDMVGHTGVFSAAVKATETVDQCLGRLMQTLLKYNYKAVIIADHGNSDIMVNPDGSPNTAHTTNPVPIIFVGNDVNKSNFSVKDGKLGDLAPSILSLMGIDRPKEMAGDIIIKKL